MRGQGSLLHHVTGVELQGRLARKPRFNLDLSRQLQSSLCPAATRALAYLEHIAPPNPARNRSCQSGDCLILLLYSVMDRT